MSHYEFYDIKSLQEYKLVKNKEGEKVKSSDIKVLKVEMSENVSDGIKVFYKTSYLQDAFKEINLQKLSRARPQLKQLYSSRISLSAAKKADLKKLISERAIPLYYACSFYNFVLN
ncbi:unnamed protein product [Parnassius apollo]|uniref:(apollo) hypothetical protein n=1 Tax=Parnassius apollo TaxID=110799 RepID=A0A8S3Y2A2_PARAO|nr:unnamed protein product [Parnassius apollo]